MCFLLILYLWFHHLVKSTRKSSKESWKLGAKEKSVYSINATTQLSISSRTVTKGNDKLLSFHFSGRLERLWDSDIPLKSPFLCMYPQPSALILTCCPGPKHQRLINVSTWSHFSWKSKSVIYMMSQNMARKMYWNNNMWWYSQSSWTMPQTRKWNSVDLMSSGNLAKDMMNTPQAVVFLCKLWTFDQIKCFLLLANQIAKTAD